MQFGKVPMDWTVSRLRSVTDLLVSSIDKHTVEGEFPVRLCNYVDVYKNEKITSRIPFMRASAPESDVRRFRLRRGDVLITKDSEAWNDIGVPALVAYEAEDLVSGYHLALLRPSPTLDGAYLHRALQVPEIATQLHVSANGVTRFGLPHEAIKSVIIPIPSLVEQRQIALFLDHMDRRINRLIRAKRRMIDLLTEQRQAIINRAVTRGLDPSVRLKPSGIEWLGDLPQHWGVIRSRRLFSVRKERARPDDIQLSATQAYGVIPQEEFEERVGHRVVKISMHLEQRKHVEKDDFVISMRSFQGGLELAHASGAIRSSYVVLRPGPSVDVDFFACLFKSRAYIGALQATADFIRDGQDLTFENFCGVDLPLVPLGEQKRVAMQIKAETVQTDAKIDKLSREIGLVREYRQRLIADVVTGKLDVRDVELPPLEDEELIDEAELVDEAEHLFEEESVDAD